MIAFWHSLVALLLMSAFVTNVEAQTTTSYDVVVYGETHAAKQQDLADGLAVVLDTSILAPGRYRLDLMIVDDQGATCSHMTQFVEAVGGPLTLPFSDTRMTPRRGSRALRSVDHSS